MNGRRALGLVVWLGVAGIAFCGLSVASTDPVGEPSWASPSKDEVVDALDGLSFEAFIETSYQLYLMRFPELLTHLGVAEMLGVRHDRLNDYSSAYIEETYAIEQTILDRLRAFDRTALKPDQQVTYDVCAWYWDDLVRGQPFALHNHPITHFYFTSLDWVLYDLLTEVHPFASIEDAEDYVRRLRGVDEQFGQILDRMDERAEAGIVVPRIMIDWAIPQLRNLAYATASRHPFYAALEVGLGAIDIAYDEGAALLEAAAGALTDEVIPAYRRLLRALESQRARAPSSLGFDQYPDGEAFYAYALRHQNQADLSAEEIHEIGLREVARVKAEIEAAAFALGMPEGSSLAEIYREAERGGGTLSGPAILAEYERLFREAESLVGAVFHRLPIAEVAIAADPVGAYYRHAPIDGSRTAEFVAPNQGRQPRYRMPTLTYHETLPGHHLQIGLSREMDLPLLRQVEVFLGHTEGWALYAERLAWELGWYGEDPYGNLGRLSDEMMRAVRLVVDTGLHVLGWSFDQATSYFAEHTGHSRGESQYNILRYAAWPGQSTSYMIGLLAILDLRERVQEALGETFDLAEFHDVVLKNGSLPLTLLERTVAEYYGLEL